VPGQRSATVLYCHGKDEDTHGERPRPEEGNDTIADLFPDDKELVTKWYAWEHGVEVTFQREFHVSKRRKVYGKRHLMEIAWGSDELERKLKHELLQPCRRYTSDMKLALKLFRLTPHIIQKVMSFMPPYTTHLQQQVDAEQERLDSPKPW